MRPLRLVALLPLALAACGGDDDSGGAAGPAPGPTGWKPPAAVCNAGAKWTPGTKAFVDATEKWGLTGIAAEGVLVSSADVDGDGRPDLAVRRYGGLPDDFGATDKPRQSWLLRNTGKTFEDVTESSGIRKTRYGTDPKLGRPGDTWAFGDVDNDGDLDVFTGHQIPDTKNPGLETSELLLNDGKGRFTLAPEDAPYRLKPGKDAPGGASFVDVDRDGNLDLWVPEYTVVYGNVPLQDRLYRGNGDGTFQDVTVEKGLETMSWGKGIAEADLCHVHSNAWGANACDLDGDGNPELLVSSYGRAGNQLWQNTGADGGFTFSNQSISSGYAWDEGKDWRDNESARCWCTLHPTDEDCAGVPAPKYIPCKMDSDAFRWNHPTDRHDSRLGGNSGSTVCADVDNDGKLDLVTTEITHWDVGSSSDRSELLLNASSGGAIKLTRPGVEASGLARTYPDAFFDEGIISASVFDFDNDGWADVYFGGTDYPENRGWLFHQVSKAKFEPVSLADGIDHHRSHGSTVADFDGDGDLDLVVGHSLFRCKLDPKDTAECYATAQVRFFENQMGGNWVKLRLRGAPGTNGAAIGARVRLTTGDLTQTREIGGGYGHSGQQDDLTVHFGLGAACEGKITVRWPDAALTEQTFDVTAGHVFVVEQGKDPKVADPTP